MSNAISINMKDVITNLENDAAFAVVDGKEIFCDYNPAKHGNVTVYKNIEPKLTTHTIEEYFDHTNTAAYVDIKHALQRFDDQWTNLQKSNFIRRLLWGEPIDCIRVDSQELVPGMAPVRWLVDGLQRYTTIAQFLDPKLIDPNTNKKPLVINKNVRRCIVPYLKTVYQATKDKNGKKILIKDDNGNPIPFKDENGRDLKITLTFDIRGKSFKQLPSDLQTAFYQYRISESVRENVTDDIIQNDILDYNNGKQMNKAQIGITLMGTEWAKQVNRISEEYEKFFSNICGFTDKSKNVSGIKSAINEALMFIYHFDDWSKDANKRGEYLGQHLTREEMYEFEDMLSLLDKVLTDDKSVLKKQIQSKNFLIVMANYFKFYNEGGDDETYSTFLTEWFTNLIYEPSDKFTENCLMTDDDEVASYADYSSKHHTKSVNILRTKLDYMNAVMEQWLKNNVQNDSDADNNAVDVEENEFDTEDEDELYDIDDHEALIAAALCFNIPREVTGEDITEIKKEMVKMPPERIEEINTDLIFFGDEAKKLMRENITKEGSSFDTPENTAALARTLKTLYDEDLLPQVKRYIGEWLTGFSSNWEFEDYADIAERDITGKSCELYNQIIKEGEQDGVQK